MFRVFAVTQPKDWTKMRTIVLESKVELTRHYILRHHRRREGKFCTKSFITLKEKLM